MTSGDFIYSVAVEVSFTDEEINLLISTGQRHYDMICRAAVHASGEEGYRLNGYIAQLRLFPQMRHVWTTSNLDLAMKILEMADMDKRQEAHALTSRLYDTFSRIQQEYQRLTSGVQV